MQKIQVFWNAILCRQVNSDSVSSKLTLNLRHQVKGQSKGLASL